MYDLVAIGELLIDFTPGGTKDDGTVLFERNPGGAPGNVLAIAAKLGRKAALIGKVGNDQFGRFLVDVLNDIGVDTKGIIFTSEANTTLAFVHLNKHGDRSFSFYRKPGADMLLAESEVDTDIAGNTHIFHFGTVSMTHQPSRDATLFAVRTAKEAGAVISFDPNLRPPLWDSLEQARTMMHAGMKYADILKVSGEELEFITGLNGLDEGSAFIFDKYKVPVILVTLGPDGCYFRKGTDTGILPAYDVKTVDTTGAGDAFLGAFLYKFVSTGKPANMLGKQDVERMIDFANAAGSLATAKKGAIPAMPSLKDIEDCMRNGRRLGERS